MSAPSPAFQNRLRWFIHAGSLAPLIWTAAGAFAGSLGANPIETITHRTGQCALIWLLLSLAVTPARRFLDLPWLMRLRKSIGLWAFAYAALHFSTYVVLDHFFDMDRIVKDIVKRPFVTAGTAALVLLVPLAVTSTAKWMQRLGKQWSRLHRLTYPAALLGVVHYWWLVKADIRGPLVYAAALALLLGLRMLPHKNA